MSAPLSDVSIVELAGGVAAAFCARLLADLGATVLRIEPPGGDPMRRYGPFPDGLAHPGRSGLFLALNDNKLGATLDPDRDAEELADLCGRADVVVESLRQEPAWLAALRRAEPAPVLASITPFGASGPFRGYRAGELGIVHASGLGYETPFNQVEDPEREPPLKPFGHQALLAAGWTATAAVLAALRRRERTGHGERVEVSEHEAAMGLVRPNFAFASHEPPDGGNRSRLVRRATWGLPWIYRCADGWVSIAVIADSHWRAIREMMGDPEWARSPLFESARGRYQHADALRPALADWVATQRRDRLYRDGQARHIPVFPLQDLRELVVHPHLEARGFFRRIRLEGGGDAVVPGHPYRWSRTPPRSERAAPAPGADDRAAFRAVAARRAPRSGDGDDSPLEGVRILDFGWVVAVPFATSWLGALGADVVRVESMAHPDPARFLAIAPGRRGVDASPYFNHLNLSKRSVTLDLSKPAGRDLVRRLVPRFDVVVENFTAGTLGRWGLAYEDLRALRKDVIVVSASPLGQAGPDARCVGWGPNTQAWAGLCALTGYRGGPPCGIGGTWPDFTAALAIVVAVLGALRHRDRTGEGQAIDLALAEVILSLLPEAFLELSMRGAPPARSGNRDPAFFPHDVYRCRGADSWIAISVEEESEWPPLARAIGRGEWAASLPTADDRRRRREEIDAALRSFARDRDAAELEHELQAAGARAIRVRNTEDCLRDPHVVARDPFVTVDHPVTGPRPIFGFPARFGTIRHRLRPAPLMGEHTRELLGELGIGDDELERLRREGVVH